MLFQSLKPLWKQSAAKSGESCLKFFFVLMSICGVVELLNSLQRGYRCSTPPFSGGSW